MRYLIGLLFLMSFLSGQVTDKNFKDKAGSGFVVVTFTSEWQEQDLAPDILKGVKGHEDVVLITAKSEDTKKICKKLRLRNFPSIALFHNGSKKEVWKADMDGEIDADSDDIKSAIDEIKSSDVF